MIFWPLGVLTATSGGTVSCNMLPLLIPHYLSILESSNSLPSKQIDCRLRGIFKVTDILLLTQRTVSLGSTVRGKIFPGLPVVLTIICISPRDTRCNILLCPIPQSLMIRSSSRYSQLKHQLLLGLWHSFLCLNLRYYGSNCVARSNT